jgi:hypothetical protein
VKPNGGRAEGRKKVSVRSREIIPGAKRVRERAAESLRRARALRKKQGEQADAAQRRRRFGGGIDYSGSAQSGWPRSEHLLPRSIASSRRFKMGFSRRSGRRASPTTVLRKGASLVRPQTNPTPTGRSTRKEMKRSTRCVSTAATSHPRRDLNRQRQHQRLCGVRA